MIRRQGINKPIKLVIRLTYSQAIVIARHLAEEIGRCNRNTSKKYMGQDQLKEELDNLNHNDYNRY